MVRSDLKLFENVSENFKKRRDRKELSGLDFVTEGLSFLKGVV